MTRSAEPDARASTARDAGAPERPDDDPGLFAALAERVAAELSRASLVLETALVESRLAASSLLLLLLAVGVALVLVTVSWALLMALAALGLAALGLGPAGGLAVVLAVHAVALVALGLVARVLAKNLRFGHTLRALGRDPEALARRAREGLAEAASEVAGGAARAAADAVEAPPPPRPPHRDAVRTASERDRNAAGPR